MMLLLLLPLLASSAAERRLSRSSWNAGPTPPWIPPPVGSPSLPGWLHDTSRPKLAYSTWVGWYMDGGLNETSLFAQVEAMADQLRPHGWSHILHDCEGLDALSGTVDLTVESFPVVVQLQSQCTLSTCGARVRLCPQQKTPHEARVSASHTGWTR